jgi:hypothetical protein
VIARELPGVDKPVERSVIDRSCIMQGARGKGQGARGKGQGARGKGQGARGKGLTGASWIMHDRRVPEIVSGTHLVGASSRQISSLRVPGARAPLNGIGPHCAGKAAVHSLTWGSPMRPRQGVIRGNATLAGSCGGHCPLTAADCPDDGLRGWRDSGDPIDVETLPDGRFSVLERALRFSSWVPPRNGGSTGGE